MPKTLLLFSSLVLASISLRAQVIAGRLADERDKAVDYANIALLRAADTSLAGSSTSDSTGAFSIPSPAEAGSYFLRINAIGFAEKVMPAFGVADSAFSKDFGTVTLRAEGKALSEVSVTASRPTIVQKGDRLEVNIEGTTMAAGNTAFTVLSRVPGVFVDHEGNIQLNGRSGVTVMIDGKLTFLSATDLRNLLESMSAENIRTIEIITNPSAKYDAEGTAGILNINFKKSTQQGLVGSVYSSYFYNFKQHTYSAGSNLFYKSGGGARR